MTEWTAFRLPRAIVSHNLPTFPQKNTQFGRFLTKLRVFIILVFHIPVPVCVQVPEPLTTKRVRRLTHLCKSRCATASASHRLLYALSA